MTEFSGNLCYTVPNRKLCIAQTGMKKEWKNRRYGISVRNLVEFILRNGDIDSRRGSIDKEAMLKGGRLHRKISETDGQGLQSRSSAENGDRI